MDETTPTMRLLEQARAAPARELVRRDLTTERRRIFSERFAAPMRPARAAWFDAWRAVADAADPGAAAAGLAAAGAAFRGMDCAAAAWLSAARDWLERARAEFPRLTCPVGHDTDPNPLHYPDAGEAEVAGWGADCGEFSAWASSIGRLGRLGSLAALPGMMRPATHVPADGPVRRGLGLLELTAAGASAADFRELLDIWGGVAWLAGLSATLAVSVAVPPPGHDFRPADLPSSGRQREAADSLLCLANGAYERCAHIEEFRRTHTAERQMTTSPVRPAGGLTAENQIQFAAEVVAVTPPCALQLLTESALTIPAAAAEPITPDIPLIDDDDQRDILDDANGDSPPVTVGQSVAAVPVVSLPPAQQPDGPAGGRWLYLNGTRHEIGHGVTFALIACMWGRDSSTYGELMGVYGVVWEEDVTDAALRTAVSRANAKLPNQVGWKIAVDSGSRSITKRLL